MLTTEHSNFDTHIFAFGDVAEHGGPRIARTGWVQASVALDNILAMIHRQTPSQTYKPNVFFESAIKLTLGKTHIVIYGMDEDSSDVMFPSRNGRLDLEIERAWKNHGANFMKYCGTAVESAREAVSSGAEETS